MIAILRWLAIVPACILSWYFALFFGIYLHGTLDKFCPPELVVSGFCTASWYPTAERSVICLGVALSAFLVAAAAAAVAPAQRLLVSRIALGIGTIVAAWMAVKTGSYLEFVCAPLSGFVATLTVTAVSSRAAKASRHAA